MGGFLSGVESLLNNPAVQQLVPIAAGAAGAALTTPRGSGVRSQIGRALLGGAQGLMDANTAKEVNLRSQYLGAQVDALHQATKDRATWQTTYKSLLEKMQADPNIPAQDKMQFQTQGASADPADWVKAGNTYAAAMSRDSSLQVIKSHLKPGTWSDEELSKLPTADLSRTGSKLLEADLKPTEYEKATTIIGPNGHVILSNLNKKDGTYKITDTGIVDAKWTQAELLLNPRREEMQARAALMKQLGITPAVVEKMQADAAKEADAFMKDRGAVSKFAGYLGLTDSAAIRAAKIHEIFENKMNTARTTATSAMSSGGELPEGAVEVDPD